MSALSDLTNTPVARPKTSLERTKGEKKEVDEFDTVGATKHCCYGDCKSDSRYKDRPYRSMQGVTWTPFPKPKTKLEKCQRWVYACGRGDFTVDNVKKWTYICSKHFVGGKGPTAEHADPIPATYTPEQVCV